MSLLSSIFIYCLSLLTSYVASLSLSPFCFLFNTITSSPRGWPPYPWHQIPEDGSKRTPPLLESPQSAFRAVQSLVPVALSPKGNSHQRQWAAYQGKQQPPPCHPATKAQTGNRERRSANIVQYSRGAGKKAQYTKPSQMHPSRCFRRLESMATQSRSQYVIVAPAASLI